ncbi:MAG: MgtC/SapB family protein [Acidimicrobiia bacterium]
MNIELEILLRVTLAAVLGGAVGFERQRQDKPAGLRTHMLVAMGSALLVGSGIIVLGQLGDGSDTLNLDILRVTAAVATGIGFLGAGTIIRSPEGVRGLTTAAGIWVTSGIGLAAGLGQYWLAVGSTVLSVVIIALLSGDVVDRRDRRGGV